MLNVEGADAYYAALSGLTPAVNFSVSDHAYAYWGAQIGASAPLDIDSRELAFLRSKITDTTLGLSAARHAYLAQQTGLTGDAAFLSRQMFAGATAFAPTQVKLTRVSTTIL